MSKHTKGPWSFGHGTSDQHHIHSEDRLVIASTCDRYEYRDRAAAQSYEEDRANAQLMAAAPDLLEALASALPFIDGEREGSTRVCDVIRAAIAKAEGRTEP